MAVTLTDAGGVPVIKVGRIAGQFAKPRSSDTETIGDLTLPSYRGDMVNAPEPSVAARTPNPKRMLKGYNRSASTLNLLRAYTRGGFAALQQKGVTVDRLGQQRLERSDFSGKNERGQDRQLVQDPVDHRLVGPVGLLMSGEVLPARFTPIVVC